MMLRSTVAIGRDRSRELAKAREIGFDPLINLAWEDRVGTVTMKLNLQQRLRLSRRG
jgi:hypothetical protein